MRAAVEDVGREDGHQHRVGHADEADERDEQDDRADRREAEGVAVALPELRHRLPRPGRAGRRGGQPHPQQRGNHRDVAHRVDQEAPALAHRRDQQARNRRPDEPRHVDHRRVERDGVAEVLLVVDHRDEERLPARHVEGVDRALAHAEHDDRLHRNPPADRQHRQDERLHHRARLRDDEQPMAVPPIDVEAGHRPEHERGKAPGEPDDAEQHGRPRQPVDEPARRRRRDPGADERQDLPGEEQPIVAIPQRPQHERDGARGPAAAPGIPGTPTAGSCR